MIDSNADRHKSGECSTEADKTALVLVDVPGRGTREVLVQHFIISDGMVMGYLGDRRDGVDFQAARENCLIQRSQAAREEFDARAGEDTDADEDTRTGTHADDSETVMTDGGRDVECAVCDDPVENDRNSQYTWCKSCRIGEAWDLCDRAPIEHGDRVEYDGREWVHLGFCTEHYVTLVPVGIVPRSGTVKYMVDVRELSPVPSRDDPYADYDPVNDGGRDDEETVMTDGGRDRYGARASAQAGAARAAAANVAALPYDVEAHAPEDKHSTPTYEAICEATGGRAEIDAGPEYGKCPDECPVCGSDGESCTTEADGDADAHADSEDGQKTLDAFGTDGNGGEI